MRPWTCFIASLSHALSSAVIGVRQGALPAAYGGVIDVDVLSDVVEDPTVGR